MYNIKEVSPSNSKTAIKSKRETSTDNLLQNDEYVNNLYQSAFAGSRVVYDRPSLEKINIGLTNANAAVDFTNENKTLIQLFKVANKSSLVHESAHIFYYSIKRLEGKL